MNTSYISCRNCEYLVKGEDFNCPKCGNTNNCLNCETQIAFDEEYCEMHNN